MAAFLRGEHSRLLRGLPECNRTTPGKQIEDEGWNKVDMGQTQQELSKEKARAESVDRRGMAGEGE
jgi:hypothetical protein